MINWGIIGLGRIAHKFAQDLAILDDAHLQAVASRSLENAKTFADQYKVPNYFGSYEEILSCRDLDVIYIATPHTSHYENTMLCLENGIAVLCEKPFTINLQELQHLVETARRTDTFLMEGMWTRFLPHLQKAMELIHAGEIGEVHTVHGTMGFEMPFEPNKRLYNPDLGGGALLDLGVYPVFLALLLLGKPDEINATAHIGTTQVDEETNATFWYKKDKKAEIRACMREDLVSDAYIYGDQGHIHLHPQWNEPGVLTLHRNGEAPKEFEFDLQGHGFYFEAREVMDCVLQDQKESKILPLQFSLDVMETLDRIRQQIGLSYSKDKGSIDSKRLQI